MKRLFICIAATLVALTASALESHNIVADTDNREDVTKEQADSTTYTQSTQTGAYGAVKVKSYPSRANVFIDGEFVGKTPITYQLPVGEHSINIEKANWSDTYYGKTITIKEFETTEETAKFNYDEDKNCYFAINFPYLIPGKITIGLGQPFYWTMSWDAYLGVDVHKKHFFGIGAGVTMQLNEQQYVNNRYYLKRPNCCFSLSALARTEFLNNDSWSPYLALAVGGNLAIKNKWDYNASSLFVNPQIGIRFITHATVALGYQYNTVPTTTLNPYNESGEFIGATSVRHVGVHSLTINLSLFFGGNIDD